MRFSTASTALFAASVLVDSALAHARVHSLWVNGVDQGAGAGKYIRQPASNVPIKDLKSADLRCNVGGSTAVSGSVKVAAGSIIEPEWFHDNRGDDIIDPTHEGPIVAYLAKASTNGAGNVWSKISEEGFSAGSFAVAKMRANGGKHSVKLPANLAAGEYILRVEILALHESDTLFTANAARGIQLYPSCSQLTVTGSGTGELPAAGVAFPGAYSDADPGIHFNLYGTPKASYIIPGPKIATLVAGSPAAPIVTSSSAAAPVVTSATVAKPSTTAQVKPSSATQIKPSSTAQAAPSPVTVKSTAAPVTSTAAPVKTSTKPAAPATTTPAPAPAPVVVKDVNTCYREYNKCLDASQPKPDFAGCAVTRDSCIGGVKSTRALRSGTLGRRLALL